MTERDLFYQHVPEIAEMVINLQEKTQEQREQWKKDCLRHAGGLNPFVYGFICKTLLVVDKHLQQIDENSFHKMPDDHNEPCISKINDCDIATI